MKFRNFSLKSECTFRSIFDHSADGIVLVDCTGMIREWSNGYEQISGLPKELVVGKMYLWDVAEMLFPLEERPREECESVKAELKHMEYVSGTWERITGLPFDMVSRDITPFDNIVHPEDWPLLNTLNEFTAKNLSNYNIALILDDSEFIDNCVALIDPMRLRQVLNNLIGNAIKFTEKGYIRFGYRQSAPDQLEFVVEDTGIGINSGQHEIIFERFRQVNLSNGRVYGGTGLGLNIASNLVQMMGGKIWVKSAEGAGASFYFTIAYLPVTEENKGVISPSFF